MSVLLLAHEHINSWLLYLGVVVVAPIILCTAIGFILYKRGYLVQWVILPAIIIFGIIFMFLLVNTWFWGQTMLWAINNPNAGGDSAGWALVFAIPAVIIYFSLLLPIFPVIIAFFVVFLNNKMSIKEYNLLASFANQNNLNINNFIYAGCYKNNRICLYYDANKGRILSNYLPNDFVLLNKRTVQVNNQYSMQDLYKTIFIKKFKKNFNIARYN